MPMEAPQLGVTVGDADWWWGAASAYLSTLRRTFRLLSM